MSSGLPSLSTISTGLDLLGTGLDIFGSSKSSGAESKMLAYQSQVAANNAAVQRQNAQAAIAAGMYDESRLRTEVGATIGAGRVAAAASGVDVGIGSPVQIAETTGIVGDLDAAMLRYNAARRAFGLSMDADFLDQESGMLAQGVKDAKTGGLIGIAKSILGGASSLTTRWQQYKKAGVPTVPKAKSSGASYNANSTTEGPY
jgi:hypothetical protein